MTADDERFVDYYNILQVDPDCDTKALETAYRHRAKMYHPDHAETADVAKLNEVIEAYRVLRDPDQRAKYDLLHGASADVKLSFVDPDGGEKAALADAELHAKILLLLYKRRREHAQDAGVGPYVFHDMLNCSHEHLEFHFWYLKAKGFIETTEQGTLAITIAGVDHVISMSRTALKEKLLIAQSNSPQDETQS